MTTLRGKDAEKFLRQITYGRPKKAAHESLRRGREMMDEFDRLGYCRVRPQKCQK